MLAVKKTNPKKMIGYAVVLLILFGATFYMVYINFLASPKTSVVDPDVSIDFVGNSEDFIDSLTNIQNNGTTQDGVNDKMYNINELTFLNSNKFKDLKNFNENIVINEDRSKNPFEF